MSEYRGEINLYDGHSIGLVQPIGNIRLHKIAKDGWQEGIRVNCDLRNWRKQGSTSGFMTLNEMQLEIPGKVPYTALIKGWEKYKEQGAISYWKPTSMKLYPFSDENVTFKLLDDSGEPNPYFYAGWTLRSDYMSSVGYRYRACVGYMGVNYPLHDPPPEWTEVPSEDEMKRLLQSSICGGVWHFKARISSFVVDPEVTQETHLTLHAQEGLRRYFSGLLDFVLPGSFIIGQFGVDWEEINWGSESDPGTLYVLSGDAMGYQFKVVGKLFTGKTPPPGCPLNTWLVMLDPSGPKPGQVGVKEGDEFLLTGPYIYQGWSLPEIKKVFGPGSYGSEDYDIAFEPLV
jgi:hypothetical protein